MFRVVHVQNDAPIKTMLNEQNEFKVDVLNGLSKSPKSIPSKYFYDAHGSEIFNQITRHPDYYLTQCELEILNRYKTTLSKLLSNEAFNLIELGPGEGIKTQILIKQFMEDKLKFTYMPIDISATFLTNMNKEFNKKIPSLELTAIHSDYFNGLKWLSVSSEKRNFLLFLGSSIGNFDPQSTKIFLQQIYETLHDGDYLLIGFDLRKDVQILLKAYNDSAGLTRKFNLNLLKRINQELHANFLLDKFAHYETYNPYIGAMESYLISLVDQTVVIDSLSKSFMFQAFEPLHVEYSYKYLIPQIENLAQATGFSVIHTFSDSRNYFVDSLWQVSK